MIVGIEAALTGSTYLHGSVGASLSMTKGML